MSRQSDLGPGSGPGVFKEEPVTGPSDPVSSVRQRLQRAVAAALMPYLLPLH